MSLGSAGPLLIHKTMISALSFDSTVLTSFRAVALFPILTWVRGGRETASPLILREIGGGWGSRAAITPPVTA